MKATLLLLIFFSGFCLSHAQPLKESVIPGTIRLTDSVECTSVKDQGNSPTCWVFGTNSVIESDVIKKYGLRLNLSEMFIARYAYIDKAERFLATGGKTYFAGGGQYRDLIRVVRRYGIVPEEVYNGRPNERFTHDHAGLDSGMKHFTHRLLKEGKTRLDEDDLRKMNDTLDKYLGKVPYRFTWQGKQYTPITFAADVVRFNEDDYIEVVSFSDKPLYKKFMLEDKFNWANDSFWNISLSDMQILADTALAKGWTVGWEGDVTEPGFNYFGGYASMPDSAYLFDKQRLENYKSEVTERDHMLHITGSGYDENGKKWYYLKNSWGTWLSKYKGYIYMEQNYYNMKTVILFVNKNALPLILKKKLGIK